MKLDIQLVDRNRNPLACLPVEGDLAKAVASASVLVYQGKYYTYSTIRKMNSAEFMEADPPLDLSGVTPTPKVT